MVYVASPCHKRQLRVVALSPSEATSIWCSSVHTAAASRPGLPRSRSHTYRRTSHGARCSLFVGHPDVGKHALVDSNHTRHEPTAGRNSASRCRRSCSDNKKSPLSLQKMEMCIPHSATPAYGHGTPISRTAPPGNDLPGIKLVRLTNN